MQPETHYARSGDVNILVGTQVLAKGHDFAGLSLVGIVSADQALYGTDFRALERMENVFQESIDLRRSTNGESVT